MMYFLKISIILKNTNRSNGKLGSHIRRYLQVIFTGNFQGKKRDTSVMVPAAAAKSLQSCPTLYDPTRLHRPWDSPGKNTGVGCHFHLQSMKVKSENEVIQSCQTLSDTMDCSTPGSSVHEIFQARGLEGVPLPSPTITLSTFKINTFLFS